MLGMEQDKSVELHVGCRRFLLGSCLTEDCAVESSPGELVGFWPSLAITSLDKIP